MVKERFTSPLLELCPHTRSSDEYMVEAAQRCLLEGKREAYSHECGRCETVILMETRKLAQVTIIVSRHLGHGRSAFERQWLSQLSGDGVLNGERLPWAARSKRQFWKWM